jgi:hypothetical protein
VSGGTLLFSAVRHPLVLGMPGTGRELWKLVP